MELFLELKVLLFFKVGIVGVLIALSLKHFNPGEHLLKTTVSWRSRCSRPRHAHGIVAMDLLSSELVWATPLTITFFCLLQIETSLFHIRAYWRLMHWVLHFRPVEIRALSQWRVVWMSALALRSVLCSIKVGHCLIHPGPEVFKLAMVSRHFNSNDQIL